MAAVTVVLSGVRGIDALLGLEAWDGFASFSFPASASDYPANYGSGEPQHSFQQVSAAVQAAATAMLHGSGTAGAVVSVDGFTNLATSVGLRLAAARADIRIGSSSTPSTSYAYFPGTNEGGDVWLGQSYVGTVNDNETPVAGNYAWHSLLHELGHALGLKHPFEAANGNPTVLPVDQDSLDDTVMTYHSYAGETASSYTYGQGDAPQSWMMLDIQALQDLYGANYATNAGDTVYTWNPGTGAMSVNGTVVLSPIANRVYETLWDGGGHDTYDLSNYGNGTRVDLTPGGWSTASASQLAYLGDSHYAQGNIANALLYQGNTASLIEDAKGGQGDDTLIGNQADNALVGQGGNDWLSGADGNDTLAGNAGNDTLLGGAGNDVLLPGTGNDSLDGGTGRDTAQLAEAHAAATLTHAADGSWSIAGPQGTDTLLNVEAVQFSDQWLQLALAPTRDFGGDGHADILWRNSAGADWIWQMQGFAVLSQDGPQVLQAGWTFDGTADFSGDGRSDVLARDTAGLLHQYDMDGLSITAEHTYADPGAPWSLTGIGDLDGDGHADLLWRNTDGTLYWWGMDGTGIGAQATIAVVEPEWQVNQVADFNGDGKADLLWRRTDGETYLWLMNGPTPLGGYGLGDVPNAWQIRGTGDFNGDGRADVLWQRDDGALYTWLMDGGSVIGGGSPGFVGAPWSLAGIGDYDADGKSDLLWRNTDTGLVYAWLMNGTTIAAQGGIAQVGMDWAILA